MTRPAHITQDFWDAASKIAEADCGCAPGRRRANGTSHSDSCWEHTQSIAVALMSSFSVGWNNGAKAEREACAAIVDAERERILSKQDGKDDGVDHNLRMIAVLFPDVAAAIRKRGEG